MKTSAVLQVALIGNPNTGKSTLFNALSGMRQRVGNYPGVTVDKRMAHRHLFQATHSSDQIRLQKKRHAVKRTPVASVRGWRLRQPLLPNPRLSPALLIDRLQQRLDI